jgi:lambda family phage portal protein
MSYPFMPGADGRPVILDHRGQPMQPPRTGKLAGAAYQAADVVAQELAGWLPALLSPDAAWLPERDTVAARTHDLVRSNGWAAGAVSRYLDNVIGSGFRLSAKPDWRALGQTPEWADEWQRTTEAAFRSWAEDPDFICDVEGTKSLGMIAGLAFRHYLIDGEALALPLWVTDRPGARWATSIQVVNPDRLSNPQNVPDTDTLRGGVEKTRAGRPVAYHIRASHPGDWLGMSTDSFRWTRVPARTSWGRRRVIHFFDAEIAGQTRGVSKFVATLKRLKVTEKHDSTELMAAIVNSIFATFIESPFDHTLLQDALTGDDASVVDDLGKYQDMRSEFHQDRRMQLNGVRIPTLFPGERIGSITPTRPNTAFSAFQETCLRNIASALGISYEQLSQDWSKTNYSSARAALMEVWKHLMRDREIFIQGFMTQIYALWLEEAIDRDIVQVPASAPGFWDARAAWTKCKWIGPARGWVDPAKEITAAAMRLELGISTLEDECAEQGKDWEEVVNQRKRELDYMRNLGLPMPNWSQFAGTPGTRDTPEEPRPQQPGSQESRNAA